MKFLEGLFGETQIMKKHFFIIPFFLTVMTLIIDIGCKKPEKQPEGSKQTIVGASQLNTGEKLFHKHCVMCHPDDGAMKGVKNWKDIMRTMRNPSPGMPAFHQEEIPDGAAEAIAQYIFLSILFKK